MFELQGQHTSQPHFHLNKKNVKIKCGININIPEFLVLSPSLTVHLKVGLVTLAGFSPCRVCVVRAHRRWFKGAALDGRVTAD